MLLFTITKNPHMDVGGNICGLNVVSFVSEGLCIDNYVA